MIALALICLSQLPLPPPPPPIPVPVIQFSAPPPLVVVQPGIQVVEDSDEEVFFTSGYYWHRHGPHWYRTRAHNGGWVVVEERLVPRTLVTFRPGTYKHYRKAVKQEIREERREHREKKRHGKKGRD